MAYLTRRRFYFISLHDRNINHGFERISDNRVPPAGSEDAEEHYRVWEDVKKRLHAAQNAQDWLDQRLNVTQAEVDAIPEE